MAVAISEEGTAAAKFVESKRKGNALLGATRPVQRVLAIIIH